MVGANGVLTGNLRASTVVAQSFVQAYYWTTETSRQLMVEFPELGLALWQSVALFVCEVCVPPYRVARPPERPCTTYLRAIHSGMRGGGGG